MTAGRDQRLKFLGLIAFRPSRGKVEACLSFIRSVMQQRPELSSLDTGSILLLAEASHVSAYGRPVTGCRYAPVEDGWRPEFLTDAVAREIPSQDPREISFDGDRSVDDSMENAFPDLSRSDMEHILHAALLLHSDPDAVARRIADMLHDGCPDYALMLEETDPEVLERKLEDLAEWGRYFYLGRAD